jgi:hypothetical protein
MNNTPLTYGNYRGFSIRFVFTKLVALTGEIS